MVARRWYAHIDYDDLIAGLADGSIPVAKLEALTGGRVVQTTLAGVLTTNAALVANRIVYSSDTGTLANAAAITANRIVVSDSNGLPIHNAALTQNRVVTADANGLPVSAAAITASRALISDANGVPTHSTLTSAQLATAAVTVSDSGRIDFTLSSNNLTADLVANSVRTADLVPQAGADLNVSGIGSALVAIASTSYADAASAAVTTTASSKVAITVSTFHGHTSGTTTYAVRRGTTVVGAEPTYTISGAVTFSVIDTPGAGSFTYNLSVKNTTPAGTHSYSNVKVIIAR